ncbi:cupin [Candidatus Bathyarchaeota archaeon RBG_13_38_9]|nr:MAG: cupin [Candidatus Bathyarchaeota archaeon RBG_13_38_9]
MNNNSKAENLTDRVSKLVDLVEYQDDTVVSRTLIDKKAGTVTLFAFGEDQGLSEHTAPFDAMVFVIDGEVEITIADNKHHLGQGETIIMPANIPHALKAIKKFKMLLIMIKSI